jgi:hypothetical protein
MYASFLRSGEPDGRAAVLGEAAQICEDCEHPPVGTRVGIEAEFLEDLLDVAFDSALGDEYAGGDGLVGKPFGDQSEHLPLAFGELVERVGAAFAGEEPGDDRWVDNRFPVGEAAERVDQVGDVETRSLSR